MLWYGDGFVVRQRKYRPVVMRRKYDLLYSSLISTKHQTPATNRLAFDLSKARTSVVVFFPHLCVLFSMKISFVMSDYVIQLLSVA